MGQNGAGWMVPYMDQNFASSAGSTRAMLCSSSEDPRGKSFEAAAFSTSPSRTRLRFFNAITADSAALAPGRPPSSMSACFIQLYN